MRTLHHLLLLGAALLWAAGHARAAVPEAPFAAPGTSVAVAAGQAATDHVFAG